MLPPGLVLTAPHEAWSPISGLSRHVAVVILALVCVGYNIKEREDKVHNVSISCPNFIIMGPDTNHDTP